MADSHKKHDLAKTLRTVYMYLVSLISVVVFIIGAVNLIDTALETWVFPASGGDRYGDPMMQCDGQLGIEEGVPVKPQGTVVWDSAEECVEYYEDRNEQERVNDRNSDLRFGISMTVVSLPIWLLHMWFIKQDKKKRA